MSIDNYLESDREIKNTTYMKIKEQVIIYLRQKPSKPFQYHINLAMIGERDYSVNYFASLWEGLNEGFDYYNNSKKTVHNKVTSLIIGATTIIDYVDANRIKIE